MNKILTPSTTRKIIQVNVSDPDEHFGIVAAGDFHIGAAAFNEPAFYMFLDDLRYYSEKEHVYVILMGDLFDSIMLMDKRFYGKAQNGTMDECMDFAKDALKPYLANPKIHWVGAISGNHELKYCGGDSDPIYRLYQLTGIDPLGSECFILFDIYMEGKLQHSLRTVAFHGAKNSMNEHGKLKIVKDFVDNNMLLFDEGAKMNQVMFYGHTHGTRVEIVRKIIPAPRKGAKGEWVQVNMVGCLTGSFFDTASFSKNSYAQDKGYTPLPIGYIKGEISINDGYEFWEVVDKFNPLVRTVSPWEI